MLELNKIYNIDCLEGLKLLDDNSIDLIITSPPYNKAGFNGVHKRSIKNDIWNKTINYGNSLLKQINKEIDELTFKDINGN